MLGVLSTIRGGLGIGGKKGPDTPDRAPSREGGKIRRMGTLTILSTD